MLELRIRVSCYVNDREEKSQFANIYDATITRNNSETNQGTVPLDYIPFSLL